MKVNQVTHHRRQRTYNRSPRATRRRVGLSLPQTHYRGRGRYPQIWCNDEPQQCTLSCIRVNNRLRKTDQADSRLIIWRMGRPIPMSKSIMTARRFSEAVTVTVFIVAILYSRRLMQSEAAGTPTLSPAWIRTTVGKKK